MAAELVINAASHETRIALIENEHRLRQALRGIREMFRKDGLLKGAA